MNPTIKLDRLTKDYGSGRGIFDVSLEIGEGEMFGFVGTNGSGKTTTIRNIMGFLLPTSGHSYVNGLESWSRSSDVIKDIGYVPGEIAFPDLRTGTEFLKSQADFLKIKDMTYANELIERLQLDPRAPLRRMSKGMKQKTAIVAALMADKKIIILDEPTTGLDPLMRDVFLDIIKAEHKKGKTILMSSHMFGELQDTCDRVALIRNGKIVDIANMYDIHHRRENEYKIEFCLEDDYKRFKSAGYRITRDQSQYSQVTVCVAADELNRMFSDLKNYKVKFITEVKYDLERHFKNILFEDKEKSEDVK